MNAEIPVSSTPRGDYAPFILEAVGDVARPRGIPPLAPDLDHLEGTKSVFLGALGLLRFARGGVAWARALAAKYPPVFRHRFGTKHTVAVSDPDLVLRVLRNEDGAWSAAIAWRAMFEGIDEKGALIHGPAFSDLDAHRDVRRLLAPAFSPSAMSRYLEDAHPSFERTIDDWIRRGTVDAKPEIRALLASIAGRTFVGFTDPKDQALLDRWMKDIWGALLAIVRNPYLDPNWRKARRAYRELMARLEALVAERRSQTTDDLLGRVAAVTGGMERDLDDDRARASVVLNVMLGAFDTTSSGLTSLVYLLAKHPEWQERLREEGASLRDRPISFEQTRSLELYERAWKETLRLYPVTPAPPRVALRDVDLDGVRVPAGSLVMPQIHSLMFDERFWTHPDRFDPDRFSPERAEDRKHRGAYNPFGIGAHTCIGNQLATAEAKAFVHVLLGRCRIRLAKDYVGTHRFEPLGMISGDVRIVLEPLA